MVIVGAGDPLRTGSINMTNGGTLICPGFTISHLGTWTPGAGTVQLSYVDFTLPTSGITKFNNLTISSGRTTMGAATTINGNLAIANGATFNAGAYPLTVTGTTTVGAGTSGTLSITNSTGTKTFTGAVTINPGASLTESAAATLSFGGDVTISGTLTEKGAAVVGIAGNLQNNGTYTASTGVHTFSGAANTLSGISETVIPSVAVTGTYQNNGILTVNNALSGSGGLTQGPNSRLNLGGPTNTAITIATLNASAIGNTVNYTGGAQTVKPATYYNLTLSGSRVKTMTGTTVSGTLDFEGSATATFTDAPTANSLTFSGVTQAPGTWGNTGSGAAHIAPTTLRAPACWPSVRLPPPARPWPPRSIRPPTPAPSPSPPRSPASATRRPGPSPSKKAAPPWAPAPSTAQAWLPSAPAPSRLSDRLIPSRRFTAATASSLPVAAPSRCASSRASPAAWRAPACPATQAAPSRCYS